MKNYDELIEKYKNSELEPAERKELEEDLQKASALFDYLMDKEDADLPELGNLSEKNQETRQIKKKISRRMLKLTLGIIAVVVVIVCGGMYLVPKAIDAHYYNPMENQVRTETGSEFSDFQLYQMVRGQVDLSRETVVSATVNRTGPGKYEIYQNVFDDFRGQMSSKKLVIDKGNLVSADSVNEDQSLVFGRYFSAQFQGSANISREETPVFAYLTDEISQLPDSSWIDVKLTLSNPSALKEIKALMDSEPDCHILGASLYTQPAGEDKSLQGDWGLRFSSSSGPFVMFLPEDYRQKLEKKYPSMLKGVTGLQGEPISVNSSDEGLIEYLTSSFQYLIDNSEDDEENFASVEVNSKKHNLIVLDQDFLKSVIKQLKGGDLRFGGIDVAVPKEKFQEFVGKEAFSEMEIKDVSLLSMNWTESK